MTANLSGSIAYSDRYNPVSAVRGESGVVHIVSVGQAAWGQSALQETDESWLQLLAGRDADGRRRLALWQDWPRYSRMSAATLVHYVKICSLRQLPVGNMSRCWPVMIYTSFHFISIFTFYCSVAFWQLIINYYDDDDDDELFIFHQN